VLAHDVTRLVRLEEQARRQSNLEALGRMAAELAHEVRNPLGSLELFASMLATDLADRPDAQELAEQVLLGVRQLSATVTRILATVRGGAPRRVALDAAALAREAASFVAPVAASRGIELGAPEGSEMLPARLDREGVLQALLNLLGNALEAAPAGGRARIAAWRRDEEIGFDVDDSGPGVPDALRARVLEPFFTTRAEGTGLGLAVVERVAIGHGGALEVTRGPLGGARFRLVLRDDAGDPA
jgi:signal transduction histidine kinase